MSITVATVARPRRSRRVAALGPLTLVLRLLPLGMGVMVTVDMVLGESADYFNASSLLKAWGSAIQGRGIEGHSFIAGQEQMGSALSMSVASALFIVEPALILSVLLLGGSAIARPFRGRGRTSA
jgi:hypothetical protein